MTKEELNIRKDEINRIVNLLCTFGDHHMSEEELLHVSVSYERYYHFLSKQVDLKFVLNNLFLTLATVDLMSLPQGEIFFQDLFFIVVTGMIDKYLLAHFMDERLTLEEERNWIKRFKETKNREPDASKKLIEKIERYQTELIDIKTQLESLDEKKKSYK